MPGRSGELRNTWLLLAKRDRHEVRQLDSPVRVYFKDMSLVIPFALPVGQNQGIRFQIDGEIRAKERL